MKKHLGRFVRALVAFGGSFLIINAVSAFEKDDVAVAIHDTDAYYNSTFDHAIKEGDKIVVYQEDKKAGKVYFVTFAPGGKQIALNASSAAFTTKPQSDAELHREVTNAVNNANKALNDINETKPAGNYVKSDSFDVFGLADAKEISAVPNSLLGSMIVVAKAGMDDPTDVQVISSPKTYGEVTTDSVTLSDHTEKINLMVVAWKMNGKGVNIAYTILRCPGMMYVFHDNVDDLPGVRLIMQAYPMVGDKTGKYFTFLLK